LDKEIQSVRKDQKQEVFGQEESSADDVSDNGAGAIAFNAT
jgi:hypothetical protein